MNERSAQAGSGPWGAYVAADAMALADEGSLSPPQRLAALFYMGAASWLAIAALGVTIAR